MIVDIDDVRIVGVVCVPQHNVEVIIWIIRVHWVEFENKNRQANMMRLTEKKKRRKKTRKKVGNQSQTNCRSSKTRISYFIGI